MKAGNRWYGRGAGQWCAGSLVGLLPALMGGCPEFRNNVVNIANDATQNFIIGGEEGQSAWDTAVLGVLSAAIDLFYDQLRDDNVR